MKKRSTSGVLKTTSKWDGLQVVDKRIHGVSVGFIVGWWTCTSRWGRNRNVTFRNFREGVVWPTKESAIEFRDSVEAKRTDTPLYKEFIRVED